ncbi:hypothetical protein AAC387_Pa08g0165 [Persea americana]|eukprot:TRINITY_DN13289_c0_g1_i1.p1 TRINITY_DN13289_c0_g1~~TRINITY_DN13289_c0_g1_i1.p1  ORF type:complete len:223 (-),score=50.10 TRINITY_DN13289_c0_g1_i1:342-1010(-)
MSGTGSSPLISIHPEELTFQFELEKQCYCNLKVANNTEHHVAFKVKTTSPKKYFVRPNTGVIQPWDSCVVTVTLQAQREYPPDMQCKDKFLLQSTKVAPTTDIDEIPQDAFNKDGDKLIEELKLRVVYKALGSENSPTDSMAKNSKKGSDSASIQTVERLKEERDSALQQTKQLRQELEMLKRRRSRPSDGGFSLTFAAFVGLIGIMAGFLLNLALSSPPTE